MIPNNQINALLNLIEDPDEDIFMQVKNELVFLGIDVIPNIEKAWEKIEQQETLVSAEAQLQNWKRITKVDELLPAKADTKLVGGKELSEKVTDADVVDSYTGMRIPTKQNGDEIFQPHGVVREVRQNGGIRELTFK